MGRRNKERIKKIEGGTEISISVQAKAEVKPLERLLLRCKKCNLVMQESRARQHIRECWPMSIADDDPIPTEVPARFLRIGR